MDAGLLGLQASPVTGPAVDRPTASLAVVFTKSLRVIPPFIIYQGIKNPY
jgi:hypothetical protein